LNDFIGILLFNPWGCISSLLNVSNLVNNCQGGYLLYEKNNHLRNQKKKQKKKLFRINFQVFSAHFPLEFMFFKNALNLENIVLTL
jgi:hypothetical protein